MCAFHKDNPRYAGSLLTRISDARTTPWLERWERESRSQWIVKNGYWYHVSDRNPMEPTPSRQPATYHRRGR
jgi:hypothetical protein